MGFAEQPNDQLQVNKCQHKLAQKVSVLPQAPGKQTGPTNLFSPQEDLDDPPQSGEAVADEVSSEVAGTILRPRDPKSFPPPLKFCISFLVKGKVPTHPGTTQVLRSDLVFQNK